MVEVPKKVQRDLNFVYVDRMDDVLPVALAAEPVKSHSRRRKKDKEQQAID
jgi:ATP-dependent Lon protease